MATLEKIRSKAALLVIVVGVALFAFLIGDGLRSGSTILQMEKNAALVVDGEKIEISDYSARLHAMQEVAEATGRRLNDEQRLQLNNQLAQEYVQKIALEKETKALGLEVSPEELNAFIFGEGVSQAYQVQQFFSSIGVKGNESIRQLLLQMENPEIVKYPQMQMVKTQWDAIIRSLKMERLRSKFSALMSRSYAINKLDVKYLSGEPSRKVAVVRNSSTVLQDTSLSVLDKEAKEYYETHKKNFEQFLPSTKVDIIAMQVRPSSEDYKHAEDLMKETKDFLNKEKNETFIARNFTTSFVSKSFLNEDELDNMNLSEKLLDFIKSSKEGAVNDPVLMNDKYELVKVMQKQKAPAGVYARLIVLDSTQFSIADSLVKEINTKKADFSKLARLYSKDENSKKNGGNLVYPSKNGGLDSLLTPSILYGADLDTLMSKKALTKKAFVCERGVSKLILQVEKIAPKVNQYKMAYIAIPVTFSDETFQNMYTKMNTILGTNSTFEDMVKQATEEGLDVRRNMSVNSFTTSLANLPSSREVVSWALNNEVGSFNDKLFRCGDSHLVIASVSARQEGKYLPFAEVEDKIKDQLMMIKRGEKLVKNLEAKKLTSLEAYAEALKTKVDTLVDVSFVSRGSVSPELSAQAMGTAIGKISTPFRAKYEVVVLKPLEQKDSTNSELQKAQMEQMRVSLGQGIGYRAFSTLINDMEIEDNRARFY